MILITGGAGYIGSHANKWLSELGYQTLILDSLERGHRSHVKWGEFIQGDFGDERLLSKIFQNYSISCVMHFAGYADVAESALYPEIYRHNNFEKSMQLLQSMKLAGVNNIVFSSTCAVYGIPSTFPLTEMHPTMPISPYGSSKLFFENALMSAEKSWGLKFAILRYFNAAGASRDSLIGEQHIHETHLIPNVIAAAFGNRPFIEIFGTNYETPDGTCIRDYIHVEDLANAHALAMKFMRDQNKSICVNLGNGNGYSVKEIIDSVSRITQRKIHVVESPRRTGDPAILVSLSEFAYKSLGWQPLWTDIDEIIQSAVNWHLKTSCDNPKLN